MAKAATTSSARTVARFRDSAGTRHRVIVRPVADGWEILDLSTRLVERLDAAYDDRSAAEAIARAFAEQHRQRPQR